ncbi:MAG: PAS domain-containing protein [Reichenbachiella sp.]|uniref:PAS domain-containing sensor histidine kinase n=1 Tax=Reichenbachiella sp. TaxID=2184521 RepID=UPI003265A16F
MDYLRKEFYDSVKLNDTIFDFIQNSSLDGLMYWDLENPGNDWISDKFWDTLGYSPNEILNRPSSWRTTINPEDLKSVNKNLQKHYDDPSFPYDLTSRYKHQNGSTVRIRCRGLAIRDKDNKAIRMVVVCSESPKEKESSEKFRQLLEIAPDAMIIVNNDGRIVMANQQTVKIFGYSKEELLGNLVEMLMPGRSASHHHHLVGQFFKSPKTRGMGSGMKLFATKKDGSEFPVEISLSPLKTEDGMLVTAAIRDITEQKRSEEIRQISDRLTLATQAAKIGIWEYDIVNNLLQWDDKMFDLYGISKSSFSGAYGAWQKGLHPDDVERSEEEVRLAINNKKKFDTEFRIIWPDQSVRHIRASALVQRNDKGEPLRMVGTNWDITERKRSEEIARKMASLKSKSKEMEQFAYIASHDLKEPLLTIKNYAKLLVEDYGSELHGEASHFTTSIVKASTRMEELITGLLEYSMLGSNHRQLKEVDCCKTIESVLHDLGGLIKSNQALVKTENLPMIKAFPLEIKLLFQNLIQNAIKFKKEGIQPIIIIAVEKIDGGWKFKIEDNGIGIAKNHKDKIFTIFRRLHKQNKYEGSGIGLAHAKKIVELHNGEIWVESEPSSGSSFYFTILTELL